MNAFEKGFLDRLAQLKKQAAVDPELFALLANKFPNALSYYAPRAYAAFRSGAGHTVGEIGEEAEKAVQGMVSKFTEEGLRKAPSEVGLYADEMPLNSYIAGKSPLDYIPYRPKVGPRRAATALPKQVTAEDVQKAIQARLQSGKARTWTEAAEGSPATGVYKMLDEHRNIGPGGTKIGSDENFIKGFMARAKARGLSDKSASALLEKSAFDWGNAASTAGNIAGEVSGLYSAGRGLRDIGGAAGMLGQGNVWGAAKRMGSSLGHLGLAAAGWIPGVGWLGRGTQAAGMLARGAGALRGVSALGRAGGAMAKGLEMIPRAADAWKGMDLISRGGAISKGIGRAADATGMSWLKPVAQRAEQFGQHLSQVGGINPRAGFTEYLPFAGPNYLKGELAMTPGQFIGTNANILGKNFATFGTRMGERGSELLKSIQSGQMTPYAQHLSHAVPLYGGMATLPMAFGGGAETMAPEAESWRSPLSR